MTAVIDVIPDEVTTVTDDDGQWSDAVAQVKRVADAAVDAVVDTRALHMQDDATGDVVLTAATGDGNRVRLALTDGGHRQLAEKLDIDWDYYQRMRQGQPDLLATNVNRWLQVEPNKRLLRMLKPITEEDHTRLASLDAQFSVRAVLSDGYKLIDHFAILKVLAPEMAAYHARLAQFQLSERHFHIRVVGPERAVRGAGVGEIIQFGVALRNSETGDGAASVELYARVKRCWNGMVTDDPYRVAHIGRKRGKGDGDNNETWLSSETRRLDDAADILKIRDRIRHGFAPEASEKFAARLAGAMGETLALPAATPFMEFVGNVGAKYDLNKGEVAALKDEALNELVQAQVTTANASRFNVAQAFTALARATGETGNAERQRELEQIGWKIVSDPLTALLKAGKAADN